MNNKLRLKSYFYNINLLKNCLIIKYVIDY